MREMEELGQNFKKFHENKKDFIQQKPSIYLTELSAGYSIENMSKGYKNTVQSLPASPCL